MIWRNLFFFCLNQIIWSERESCRFVLLGHDFTEMKCCAVTLPDTTYIIYSNYASLGSERDKILWHLPWFEEWIPSEGCSSSINLSDFIPPESIKRLSCRFLAVSGNVPSPNDPPSCACVCWRGKLEGFVLLLWQVKSEERWDRGGSEPGSCTEDPSTHCWHPT